MSYSFFIDPDITKAETLPAKFYKSKDVFDLLKEMVFLKSWHWIGDSEIWNESVNTYPFILHGGYLSEPLLLTKDENGDVHCLSNVCTHRANLVSLQAERLSNLTCSYHGRRFGLDGRFKSMPEFKEAKNFPRACDHLKEFDIREWGPFLFVGLDSEVDMDAILNTINQRIGFMPLGQFVHDESLDKDYFIDAHWALYCDNYLEGFHIPFVHDGLNAVLNYDSYRTELYDHCILQVGYADSNENTFDLPDGHVDYGRQVAAYYFFVFPNMMFNFYPWGLSINIVRPMEIDRTKVSFVTYVYDRTKLDQGAGEGLDKVEQEDEEVVENVNKGLESKFYTTGRFSPNREQGVHYFHQLLAKYTTI